MSSYAHDRWARAVQARVDGAAAARKRKAARLAALEAVAEKAWATVQAMEGVRLPFHGEGWMRLLDLRNALAALGRSGEGR